MPGRVRRVVLTCDAIGGVWTHAVCLSAGLAARGVEVCLVVIGPAPSEEQRMQVAPLRGVRVVEVPGALDWTARDARDLRSTEAAVRRLCSAFGADLVHVNSPALVAQGRWPVPLIAGAHSCLGTWWRSVKRGPVPCDFDWRIGLTREGLGRARAVIAPTVSFVKDLLAYYGVGLRVSVVRNGLVRGTKSETRGNLILTAGRLWDEGKNVAVLDTAAGLMTHPVHAAGALTGPNGETYRVRNLVSLGVIGKSEMEATFAATAIYAAPSLYEPFGLSVLEAAQHGAALVLSDIPTFRELWSGAAVFVDPRSASAWAQTLTRLASDEDLRAALGQAAFRRAQAYSAERMVEGVLGLYQAALRGKPGEKEALAS